MNKVTSLFVVLLLLLGMIAIEPAEARRGGYRHVGGRGGGRSVMRSAGRMSRVLSRSLLGGRRGHGWGKHRNRAPVQSAADPIALDPNAVNGGYGSGNPIGN